MAYFRYDYVFPSAPSVSARKNAAATEIARLTKQGRTVTPVRLEGRTIARTYWGKAWCENLERYSDIANRIARGRSYVRSGSVVHLAIAKGRVDALVRGSSLYEVTLTVQPVAKARYRAIVEACAGKIDSVIELLQGKLSGAVTELIASKDRGLFPEPKEIGMTCSCPDSATMCKHVAAVLYGVGARFDQEPKLLFELRGADPSELVASAAEGTVTSTRRATGAKTLEGDLAGMFGIELDLGPREGKRSKATSPKKKAAKKAAETKTAKTKALHAKTAKKTPEKRRRRLS